MCVCVRIYWMLHSLSSLSLVQRSYLQRLAMAFTHNGGFFYMRKGGLFVVPPLPSSALCRNACAIKEEGGGSLLPATSSLTV